MNNDTRLIFEAYVARKQMLSEIPAYAAGDLSVSEPALKAAPGGGYGLKKQAEKEGKPMKEIADALAKKIQTALFKPETHQVDGVEYTLYYPGNEMKLRNDLQALIQKELGLGKTESSYTARIMRNMLNIIVKDGVTGGVAARPEKVKSAIDAAIVKPVTTETVYEIEKSIKIPEKNIRALVLSLPDEDVPEKEILGVLKNAISEFNDRPGLDKKDLIKAKSIELVDTLVSLGVLKVKQVDVASSAEGEGSGEVQTVDDFPETDDAGAALRDMGATSRGAGYDPGSFSYND